MAEMRRESGAVVSCVELPENSKNKGRGGCDVSHRELPGVGRDENREEGYS